MLNLMIELDDILTSNSCSLIIVAIIKYAAYNARQIPFSYDALTRTVSLHKDRFNKYKDCSGICEDDTGPSESLKQMKANLYFKRILTVFEHFELTFKNLELELCSSNVREVMVIFGPNLSIPKSIIRIALPDLSVGHSIVEHHVRKNLLTVFRKLQGCKELHDQLYRTNGPTNMHMLLGMQPNAHATKTAIFEFVDYIVINDKIPQTKITLNNPKKYNCSCTSKSALYMQLHECTYNNTNIKQYNWYKSKYIIEGFKDIKIQL